MNRLNSVVFCCTFVCTLFLGAMLPMATPEAVRAEDTTTIDWAKIQKDAEARKNALNAQKDAIEAKKALDDAKDPAKKAQADKIEASKAAKDVADADKAAADARKAEAEASQAALKAQIGDITASGYKGTVDLKDKAGVIEAALLAAKALQTAAREIYAALPRQAEPKSVLLFAAAEVPNFQSQIAFRAQIVFMLQAFKNADEISKEAMDQAPPPPSAKMLPGVVAGAGLALDAANKLMSYFRTDYTVGGTDVTFDDSLLIHALAGRIAESGMEKNIRVILPAVYSPGALSNSVSELLRQLEEPSKWRLCAQINAKRHEEFSEHFTKEANDSKKKKEKAENERKAKIHKDASDVCKAATNAYDGFINKFVTADDKGMVLISNIIRDDVIANALSNENNLLLLVKLHKSGGSYYTKSNIVTSFGGMPFYHMGGVVASFVFLDGKTGEVLKSGIVPVHGGFVKADDLPQELK